MSTNMSDIVVGEPDGSTKKVLDLDDHQRDHRNANKVTWGVEHSVATVNEAGKHKFPIVTDAQEAALTDNPTGRMVQNTTKIMLRYFDGAAWQDCIGAVFASGTRMVFDNDAAPTGWTRDATQNDKVIRVVTGARADAGSWTISGLTNAAEAAHTHSTPNHVHPFATVSRGGVISDTYREAYVAGGEVRAASGSIGAIENVLQDDTTNSGSGTSGGGSSHNHVISAGSSWRPLHRDMIIAEKD